MEKQVEELLGSAMASYRAALVAMGESGAKALPHFGETLRQNLLSLSSRLSSDATPDFVTDTEQQVEEELLRWSTDASAYLKQKVDDVKEIILIVAHSAETISERDQRYASRLNELTVRLHSIADLDDLTEVRRELGQSTSDLKACVDKMALDSRQAISRLNAELSTYQCRLIEAERLASLDSLTGLVNRREVERQIELRVGHTQAFCLILLDLDGFKQINDRHGHLAGDDILKQFSKELRSFFRATDIVGRWGGDEFVVIADCGLKEAEARMEKLREWIFGEYPVRTVDGSRRVGVSAAVGLAAWKSGESPAELLARADAAMYRQKQRGDSRR